MWVVCLKLQPRHTNGSHEDDEVSILKVTMVTWALCAQSMPVHQRKDDSLFLGMISRCFEPHLNVYITSQDK